MKKYRYILLIALLAIAYSNVNAQLEGTPAILRSYVEFFIEDARPSGDQDKSKNWKYCLNCEDELGCDVKEGYGYMGPFVHDFEFCRNLRLKGLNCNALIDNTATKLTESSFKAYYRTYGTGIIASIPGEWHEMSVSNRKGDAGHECSDANLAYYYWAGDGDDQGVNLLAGKSPGHYELEMVYAMEYFDLSDVSQGRLMIPGNVPYNAENRGFIAQFSVPGFYAQNLDMGKVRVGQSSTVTYTFDSFGWHEVTISMSGAGASAYSIPSKTFISDDKGNINVTFAPVEATTYNVTVTLTGRVNDQDYTTTFTITGEGVVDSKPAVTYIGDEPSFSDGTDVTLYGYLRYQGCTNGSLNDITECGFYYAEGLDAVPGINSSKIVACGGEGKTAGSSWSATVRDEFELGKCYSYRTYVYSVGSSTETYLSDSIGHFCMSAVCDIAVVDTVLVTIDNSLASDNICELKFRNIPNAISAITQAFPQLYSDGRLLTNVKLVIHNNGSNYIGTALAGANSGAKDYDAKVIKLEGFNNVESPNKMLVLAAADEDVINKPVVQHLVIRNSKNIELRNLNIEGSATPGYDRSKKTEPTPAYDNALDIDNGDNNWGYNPDTKKAVVENSGIVVKHCNFKSSGFTCVNISSYSGLLFDDCNFDAKLASDKYADDSTIGYGAAVKMFHCSQVKFLRNSIRGQHATTLWLQDCQNLLAMNNVLWNDDKVAENLALVRLVCQTADDQITKVGLYYNTMYMNDGGGSATVADFLRLGSFNSKGSFSENVDRYANGNIDFKYNNCYAYRSNMVSRSTDTENNYPFLESGKLSNFCGHITYNNFWSQYDYEQGNSVSSFALIPCDDNTKCLNVKNQMCQDDPSDPSSLVIKGTELNIGSAVSDDISEMGAALILSDRSHGTAVRPVNTSNWTLGAYQSASGDNIDVIVWTGGSDGSGDEWDNRSNWLRLDGKPVTCLDNLTDNLEVIIPAPKSSNYPVPSSGINSYPELPEFTSGERPSDKVVTLSADKFAKNITIEDGGALKGVEHLKSGDSRYYDVATRNFMVGRSEWVLVGTVIKKLDNESVTGDRDAISEDFYLMKEPHVYMHEAKVVDDNVDWNNPFPDLNISLPSTKAFAIRIPDQYGPNKLKASSYYHYRNPAKVGDGTVPKEIEFSGHLYNESSRPVYDGLTANVPVLLSNTYPANILVGKVSGQGSFQVYDYNLPGFRAARAADEIKPQHGFLFTPSGTSLDVPSDAFTSGSTKYKSAVEEEAYGYVSAKNMVKGTSGVLLVKYDPLKNDSYIVGPDAPMIFNNMNEYAHVPQLYALMYEKSLSGVTVPDAQREIPLGLIIQQDMIVRLECGQFAGLDSLILVDRENGGRYNLLEGQKRTISLKKGTYEGRFFLNFGEASDDIITDVTDNAADAAADGITILSNGKSVVISSTDNVSLEKAYITDMSGRTNEYTLSNKHYNKIDTELTAGVYVVKVVADNCSRTEKIIVR